MSLRQSAPFQDETSFSTPSPTSNHGMMQVESQNTAPKPRGPKRLLHGLQRMSSSQSLLRLHRTSSSSYRGTGRGSISCISLSSTSPLHGSTLASSYAGSHFTPGFSTAPTSIPSTPAAEAPSVDDTHVRWVHHSKTSSSRDHLKVAVPADIQSARPATSTGGQATCSDYFSCSLQSSPPTFRRSRFEFWAHLPAELRTDILCLLEPREIVRCSRVSRSWHRMCFDGHLWANLDITPFYQTIPADVLVNIITKAGPFARDLNLRGCVQLWDRWRSTSLADACHNLENLSLEGCRIDRSAVHTMLYQNRGLAHINVSGLGPITNTSLKIIAQHCPRLEHLNISWCSNVDTKGLKHIVQGCLYLRDLRASEVRGFGDISIMNELFEKNSLERLVLVNCDSLTEAAFSVLFGGIEPEKDYLTDRSIVPPRRLKHLDIARCRAISDDAMLSMVGNTPALEGLQLSKCSGITDRSLTELLPTLPSLTHLDLEELDQITNLTLQELSKSKCKGTLKHLSVSYCENVGDTGMLPVVKHCGSLQSVELDNTRISDLVLIEAAAAVRARPEAQIAISSSRLTVPEVALSMVVYDCQNVTWIGIREVLSRNAEPCNNRRGYPLPIPPTTQTVEQRPIAFPEVPNPAQPVETLSPSSISPPNPADTAAPVPSFVPTYPAQIIALKVFYGYQPTVTEHMRRCLRGDFAAAGRLERKWAEYMVASEEAGAPGGFGPGGFGLFTGVVGRRRRRRIREAAMMHADEEDEGGLGVGVGRRRRARSGGSCAVM